MWLCRPEPGDLADLHAICSDPRVWEHFPSRRHTDLQQTESMLHRWQDGWAADDLGVWTVRQRHSDAIIGYGGCSVRQHAFWNLGYRFAFSAQGNGFATEVAKAGVDAARAVRPELPVVAYLLQHNAASARVAEKVGLRLVHQGPDEGNPDPTAIRCIYADRELTERERAAALR
nr:GNAT family N-acetyltransferase [Nakamurella aerolata]